MLKIKDELSRHSTNWKRQDTRKLEKKKKLPCPHENEFLISSKYKIYVFVVCVI